jgi:potassium/hydrogen antiporter
VFLSVLSGVFSSRLGFPFLLVFLVGGILAGEDGPGRLQFDDFSLAFWVGNAALAVILLDGGLRTSYSTFRTGLKPSLLLATLGVAVSAAVTGLAATWLLGLPWQVGLLLGAVVGSTDAAAVFALLKQSGVTLNERVATTLEIESGLNDPMAVYLTLALIAVSVGSVAGFEPAGAVLTFLRQFGLGTLVGLGSGAAMAALLVRAPASDPGITALLLVSGGLTVFAATGLVGGSGFLAVYLFGMVAGNRAAARVDTALSAMDGYAWLSQAGMFLLLGLLVTPREHA